MDFSNQNYNNSNSKANDFFEQMNKELGNALSTLYEPEHSVIGREKEIKRLNRIMKRPITKIALLIGPAGVGKTAIVETWLKRRRKIKPNLAFFTIDLGALSKDGNSVLQARLEKLLPLLEKYEKLLQEEKPDAEVVLFIDEFHRLISIFGSGTKAGGDTIKPYIARPTIKLITATTETEFENYIANDDAFDRRLKPLPVKEQNKEVIKHILQESWLSTYYYPYTDDRISDKILDKIITANRLYRPNKYEPDISIDVLEDAIAAHKDDNVPIDNKLINEVFEDYGISLDFQANFKEVYQTILKRVIGQPMALYMVGQAIKKLTFKIDNFSNRPKSTMLFIGPSGVGKTEMTKALAEGLYHDDNQYKFFNMADYSLSNSSPMFRKDLGKSIKHDTDTVILIDEIEKAHKNIIKDFLAILEEGIVRYHEKGADGYMVTPEVSLKNTIIIATSNVAAELFKDVHQYSRLRTTITQENMNEFSASLKQEYRDLEGDIHDALIAAFSPEFVGRFSNIVPFYALHETTLIEICHRSIMNLIKDLNSRPEGYNIKVRQPKKWSHGGYDIVASELTMYVCFELANIDDSNFGGARAIMRYIDNEVFPSILDAILDNPDKRRFYVHTNGKCSFENPDYQVGLGDIVVEPAS